MSKDKLQAIRSFDTVIFVHAGTRQRGLVVGWKSVAEHGPHVLIAGHDRPVSLRDVLSRSRRENGRVCSITWEEVNA